MPDARYDATSYTVKRSPRMHGFPPILPGSTVIRGFKPDIDSPTTIIIRPPARDYNSEAHASSPSPSRAHRARRADGLKSRPAELVGPPHAQSDPTAPDRRGPPRRERHDRYEGADCRAPR